jgi:hypothetical protein
MVDKRFCHSQYIMVYSEHLGRRMPLFIFETVASPATCAPPDRFADPPPRRISDCVRVSRGPFITQRRSPP